MTKKSIRAAEKFYKKLLQKKYSRKINLDRSRIFSALTKFNIDPDIDLSGNIIQCLGSDGKNSVVQSILSILLENKKKVTTFTSPAITSPLDRIFIKDRFITPLLGITALISISILAFYIPIPEESNLGSERTEKIKP